MKRFILATLALFAVALSAAEASGPARVVRQRVAVRSHGAHAFIGGAAFRAFGHFGYGHAAFVQPFVTASIVQPFQALTTVEAVAPLAVTDHCAGALVQPVVAVASPFIHTARIVRQRFGYGFGARAFLGGGLYGGFGARGFRFR